MASSDSGIFLMPQSPSGIFDIPEQRSHIARFLDTIWGAVKKGIVERFYSPGSAKKRLMKKQRKEMLEEFMYLDLGSLRSRKTDDSGEDN